MENKKFKITCCTSGAEMVFENKQPSLNSDLITLLSTIDDDVIIGCSNKDCKNEVEIW